VKLTWEGDDPDRANVTRRTLSHQELETMDFRAYLASSDSESIQSEGDAKERLRDLLLQGHDADDAVWDNKHDRQQEMEITFTPGVVEAAKDDIEETTLERYKRRHRERRLERKANLLNRKESLPPSLDDGTAPHQADQLADIAASEDVKHFDMTSIVKSEKLAGSKGKLKRKQQARLLAKDPDLQEDFVLDASDPRFAAMHTNHQFALDPSSSQFVSITTHSPLILILVAGSAVPRIWATSWHSGAVFTPPTIFKTTLAESRDARSNSPCT
jgi:hypothetical protein